MARSKRPRPRKRARPGRAPTTPTRGTSTEEKHETALTLDEARALATETVPRETAGARRGARRVARRGPDRVVASTPAALGAERERLEADRKRTAEERIEVYRRTLELMKARGAREPAAPASGARRGPRRAAVRSARVVPKPLQIVAEGDSWFDYPVPFFGGGIIDRLEDRIGIPILNLAKAGDEVRFMLGVEERKELVTRLREGCPAGGPWDVLLFSGGGNDIVGNPMVLWVKDYDASVAPERLIHQQRFATALDLIRAGYEDLIELRDRLSPNTQLIFQTYDFPIPDGRGVCHIGPWLKPSLDVRGFRNQKAGFEVTKAMLRLFAKMLKALAAAHSKVTVIDGQGTLNPVSASWHNELHPAKSGFETFADKFRTTLVKLFPDRVF